MKLQKLQSNEDAMIVSDREIIQTKDASYKAGESSCKYVKMLLMKINKSLHLTFIDERKIKIIRLKISNSRRIYK